jgi:hypothetical protein
VPDSGAELASPHCESLIGRTFVAVVNAQPQSASTTTIGLSPPTCPPLLAVAVEHQRSSTTRPADDDSQVIPVRRWVGETRGTGQ